MNILLFSSLYLKFIARRERYFAGRLYVQTGHNFQRNEYLIRSQNLRILIVVIIITSVSRVRN